MTEDHTERLKYHVPLLFFEPASDNASIPINILTDIKNRSIDRMIYLLNQQKAYNSRVRNSSLPAISCLPPEILSQIFLDAVTEEASLKPSFSVQTVVPLRLSHVCYTWRMLALSLSEIWASVHCRVRKGKVTAQAAFLEEWLSRSNGRLLSIRVSFEDEALWKDSQSDVMAKAIIPHSRRWKHLDLVVPKPWFPILKHAEGKVENLESLSLRALPGIVYSSQPMVFCEAPRLRKILVKSLGLILPWTYITSVSFYGLMTSQIFEFLKFWPHLISAKFFDLREEDFVSTESISHATLERFSLCFPGDFSFAVDEVLDNLILPKLRYLTLMLPKHHPSPSDVIQNLILRSACPIKSIEVGGPVLSEEDTTDLLQLSKDLVHINNHLHPFVLLNGEDD
ncbi:hypothetical protein BDN70DRAFT_827192 [Pholiota conissans]|uniref:F-box domain-containing protein n=1 Tax=Pholiota conissans TaxID=109636 RepID=A0A9P5ZBJ7_9AGAR|nr:hypothetical protein BDN70DRAFT_827192 [Pholiota conissans]